MKKVKDIRKKMKKGTEWKEDKERYQGHRFKWITYRAYKRVGQKRK